MHAGGTLGLFPVLRLMAEPWQPCKMRQKLALTTCRLLSLLLLPS